MEIVYIWVRKQSLLRSLVTSPLAVGYLLEGVVRFEVSFGRGQGHDINLCQSIALDGEHLGVRTHPTPPSLAF